MQINETNSTAEHRTSLPTVAIIGLGFIGLPLAMSYTRMGCRVIGVDVNEAHVQRLKQGKTSSIEMYEGYSLEHYLQSALDKHLFTATTDFSEAAREATAFIITVGIPILDGVPIYQAIDAATASLAPVVKPGDLLLYRSTHIPGTLRNRIIPLLQRLSTHNIGTDVHIAYAPERVAEGRAMEEFQTVDVLIGGLNDASTAHAMDVLQIINRAHLYSTSMELAETSKVVENVQRDVNIAMMQEIARFAQGMGMDTAELVRLSNTHPRVNLLTPGAGVGGYCIPNAYFYLQAKADELGISLPILSLARATNHRVPHTILERIEVASGFDTSAWSGKKVAILGLAMKNYSNDDRLSPSLSLIEALQQLGAEVRAYDPLVELSAYAFAKPSLNACLADAEIVILAVQQETWQGITVDVIKQHAPLCHLIFDACHAVVSEATPSIPLLRI